MLNFHSFDIQTLTLFFNTHPYSAGIFTYFIVFIEAMAVIGSIVPGSITMSAIGFLIGSSVIPVGSTFLYAIAGAITGDCLSYLLGIYFQNRIHRIWPFTKWPNLLTRSEKFFHNHGGKSVFIGRFVGPARAMIPMVAGMLKMPLSRFLIAAIPSVTIWAIAYMIPGILLGALSLELPTKVAAKFTVWVLLAAIGLWLIIWLIRHFFKQISQMLDYYIMHGWKFCQKNSKLNWITKILADPKEPDNHKQLTLLLVAFFIFILFLWVLHQVLNSGILISLSHSVYYLLCSLRSQNLDNIFILFTMLGDAHVLLLGSGIVFLWFIWKKYWYTAAHWFSVIAIIGTVITSIKFLFHSPRPGAILYGLHASSFPSAHVALSLSFYGFLAVIIARELKISKKYLPYTVAGILVATVAFSRIYLGAHWLVDILASILLGLVMVLLATVSYHKRHMPHFKGAKCGLVVSVIFTGVWLGYGIANFKQQVNKYTLIWPHKTLSFDDLMRPTNPNIEIPLYRLNRLGGPIEAFNVIYVGELATIGKALILEGWEPQPISLSFQDIIKSFSTASIANHLTIFPQLYHNKKVALLLTKKTDRDNIVLILRLWPSNISLNNVNSPLWIGSAEYNYATPNLFSLKNFENRHRFIGATKFLTQSLSEDFSIWKFKYPLNRLPQEVRGLHWDGNLLVIRHD